MWDFVHGACIYKLRATTEPQPGERNLKFNHLWGYADKNGLSGYEIKKMEVPMADWGVHAPNNGIH